MPTIDRGFWAPANVTQALERIDSLDTRAAEDLKIAFRLVRHLESFDDEPVVFACFERRLNQAAQLLRLRALA